MTAADNDLQLIKLTRNRTLTRRNPKPNQVTVAGSDLQLIKRVEGEFFSRFELRSFPFDAQDLTITIGTHCATAGPVPMTFTVPPSADMGVGTAHQAKP